MNNTTVKAFTPGMATRRVGGSISFRCFTRPDGRFRICTGDVVVVLEAAEGQFEGEYNLMVLNGKGEIGHAPTFMKFWSVAE